MNDLLSGLRTGEAGVQLLLPADAEPQRLSPTECVVLDRARNVTWNVRRNGMMSRIPARQDG